MWSTDHTDEVMHFGTNFRHAVEFSRSGGTPARTFRTDWGQPTKLYSVRSTRSTRRPLHGRATERRPLNRTTTIPALIPAARNDLEPPAPVTASPRSSASAPCRRGWIGRVAPRLSFLTGGPVRPGAVAVRDLVSPTWVGRTVRRRAPGSAGGARPPSGRRSGGMADRQAAGSARRQAAVILESR